MRKIPGLFIFYIVILGGGVHDHRFRSHDVGSVGDLDVVLDGPSQWLGGFGTKLLLVSGHAMSVSGLGCLGQNSLMIEILYFKLTCRWLAILRDVRHKLEQYVSAEAAVTVSVYLTVLPNSS